MNDVNERVLCVKDFLFYSLYKWKWVLLFMLLGGGLFCLYDYVKTANSGKQNQLSYEEIAKSFSEKELSDVNRTIEYNKQKTLLKDYIDTSILMSLDPSNLEVVQIHFVIDLDDNTIDEQVRRELLATIIKNYSIYINGGSLTEKLVREYSQDLALTDLNTLVSCSYDEHDSNVGFVVEVTQTDKIDEFAQSVMDEIFEYEKAVDDSIARHQLRVVGTYDSVLFDYELLIKQQGIRNEFNTYEKNVATNMATFSENQKKYYSHLIGNKVDDNSTERYEARVFNLKSCLLGMIGGLVFCALLFVIQYLMTDFVMSRHDYTIMLGLKNLGELFEEKIKDSHSLIKTIQYGKDLQKDQTECYQNICSQIKLFCKKKKIDRIALISSNYQNVSEEIYGTLGVYLSKNGIESYVLSDILECDDTKNTLLDTQACVLLEKKHYSKVSNIQKVIEVCEDNEIYVVGVVDIKE